jgi:hypothetical protein
MTQKKNIDWGTSKTIRLKTSGIKRPIAVCAINSVWIGINSPFVASAAMPIRAGIAVEKLLRKRSSSTPQTTLKKYLN